MSNQNSLQDKFLATLRDEHAQVSIFLVNGIKLHGIIDDFDSQVILLKNAITQMIFKQAVSTVVPARTTNSNHSGE